MKINKNTLPTLAFIITLALLLIYGQFFRKDTASFQPVSGEDSISFSYGEDFSAVIRYADITALEIVDEMDFGECIQGETGKYCTYGTWQNDTLGRYQLLVHNSVARYIIVSQTDSVFVFNYESVPSTDAFYEALQKMVQE